jgi:hypothetical protein
VRQIGRVLTQKGGLFRQRGPRGPRGRGISGYILADLKRHQPADHAEGSSPPLLFTSWAGSSGIVQVWPPCGSRESSTYHAWRHINGRSDAHGVCSSLLMLTSPVVLTSEPRARACLPNAGHWTSLAHAGRSPNRCISSSADKDIS